MKQLCISTFSIIFNFGVSALKISQKHLFQGYRFACKLFLDYICLSEKNLTTDLIQCFFTSVLLILNKLLKNYQRIKQFLTKLIFSLHNFFLLGLQSIEAGHKFSSVVLYKNDIDCNFSGIGFAETLNKSQMSSRNIERKYLPEYHRCSNGLNFFKVD